VELLVTELCHQVQTTNLNASAGDVQIVSDIATLRGAFDLVLESVGGESLTAALRLVGRDGIVAMFSIGLIEDRPSTAADRSG
jgi:NADPH:quinone reductase-like Zn-dependent oxidoreductase